MFAIDDAVSSGLDALPVCLLPWRKNSDRLMTLLDLMRRFFLPGFLFAWHGVSGLQFECLKIGRGPIDDKFFRRVSSALQSLRDYLQTIGFDDSVAQIDVLLYRPRTVRDSYIGESLAVELQNITDRISSEIYKHEFVQILPDRKNLFESKELFGPTVATSFPSASVDIKEALDCLAVEANTAAVFHLMRVSEYGLRALAYDRRIHVRRGPIELATWEDIIRELEGAETAIQGYPRAEAREAQLVFYHKVMMEFRAFKNLWRNRVMHTRDLYDRDQAHSALVHVRAFMQELSMRIAEGKRTPVIWKRAISR